MTSPRRPTWTGSDPRLRQLRTATALVLLFLLAIVIIEAVLTDGNADIATVGALIGALLVDLGFEAGIRWAIPAPPRQVEEEEML